MAHATIYHLRLENNNQQHQNDNQNHNRRHLLVIRRRPRNAPNLVPRTIQPSLVSIHKRLLVLKHSHMVIQLVANLHAQLPLPANRLAQPIELLVLVGQDLAVVLVDLLVRLETGRVVVVALRCVRVIAVGAVEERRGGGIVIVLERGGRRRQWIVVVGEADLFLVAWGRTGAAKGRLGGGVETGRGRAGWFQGRGMCKVGGKRGVVGMGDGGCVCGGGEAVELRGEVVVLFLESRKGVRERSGFAVCNTSERSAPALSASCCACAAGCPFRDLRVRCCLGLVSLDVRCLACVLEALLLLLQ